MTSAKTPRRQNSDELLLLEELIGLQAQDILELGCGSARLLRRLLAKYPQCHATALETDRMQMAKNLAQPAERLQFIAAPAENIPPQPQPFDLALMLKSLHHVAPAAMAQALAEIHRNLRPNGLLYVSEPLYEGALNQIMSLFNDEKTVRAAAQQALANAIADKSKWQLEQRLEFDSPVHYADFADFEQRMLHPTFIDRRLTTELRQRIRQAFEPHLTEQGAHFLRPMQITLLRAR